MPDYQLGKIYQIVCLTTGQKYIGSTTQKTLAIRLSGHVSGYKYWMNGKGWFVYSYSIIEEGNYQIELLEAFPCNSKDELNAREGYYIRTIDCVNKRVEGRTTKEYHEVNKEKIAEYHKEWRKENHDEVLEKGKAYYDANKTEILSKLKTYRDTIKVKLSEQHKAYREKNKTKVAEQRKAYYQANKERINEQRRKK